MTEALFLFQSYATEHLSVFWKGITVPLERLCCSLLCAKPPHEEKVTSGVMLIWHLDMRCMLLHFHYYCDTNYLYIIIAQFLSLPCHISPSVITMLQILFHHLPSLPCHNPSSIITMLQLTFHSLLCNTPSSIITMPYLIFHHCHATTHLSSLLCHISSSIITMPQLPFLHFCAKVPSISALPQLLPSVPSHSSPSIIVMP